MSMFGKKQEKQEEAASEKSNRGPAKAAEPAPLVAAPAAPPPPAKAPAVGFGIAKAISLMKSMPTDAGSPPAYVKVIEKTLEAVGVEVGTILKDGDRRIEAIIAEAGALQTQLQALDSEMGQKRKKLSELKGELDDIKLVQERFGAAAKPTGQGPGVPANAPVVRGQLEVSHLPPGSS